MIFTEQERVAYSIYICKLFNYSFLTFIFNTILIVYLPLKL